MRWAAALLLALAACGHTDPHELYQRGRVYYRLGDYRSAIRDFEAAYRTTRAPALLYDLAQAHRLDGDKSRALPLYRAYLHDVPNAKNRFEVEQRIAELVK